MNREIKFRVWHTEFKRFLGKEEYCLDLNGKLVFVELAQNHHTDASVRLMAMADKSYVIQQFTGLKDNNGKEIFEGDIVKITSTDTQGKYPEDTRVLEIKWNYYDDGEYVSEIECWMADSYQSISELLARTKYLYNTWQLKVEIVGNIFQNPELIQKSELQ